MSTANDILQEIKENLQSYGGLKEVNFFTYEDETDLVTIGKFPFINLYMNKLLVTEAPPHKIRDYERHLYSVLINFGVRHKTKSKAMEGDGTKKGVWDIWENIQAAVRKDMSFDGNVTTTVWKPEIEVDCARQNSGDFWIGGGAVVFQVYKDVLVRSLNKY